MNEGTLLIILLLTLRQAVSSANVPSQHEIRTTQRDQITTSSLSQPQKRSATCSPPTPERLTECNEKATPIGHLNEDTDADLDFFQKCIAEYYCFTKEATVDEWTSIPTFRGAIGTNYFNAAAKRAEMFFIRYNDWPRVMTNSKFRDQATGACTNLLYIIAARHLYAIYALDQIRGERTFGPCDTDTATNKLIVPSAGVCYPAHHGVMSCTSDHDIALIGMRSGTMTAAFNQFFRESIGTDPVVVGFGKSCEELFNSNVYAFTMEFAMPKEYSGLSTEFVTEVEALSTNLNFQIQEIIVAIFKMKNYKRSYYNDFNSDRDELRRQPTKHNLFNVYQAWAQKMGQFFLLVKSVTTSASYVKELHFRRRQNIAYELIMGTIELHNLPYYAGKALGEIGIALLYGADTYHTRGAIRHVVGWTQMKNTDLAISITDYAVSMVENWADTVKEYYRECASDKLVTMRCLPKLSKFMWRMLDAMFAVHSRLRADLQTGLLVVDNSDNTGLRSIVAHWLVNVKKKGLSEIPGDDSLPGLAAGVTPIDSFLQEFQCGTEQKQARFSVACMDNIHERIRQYLRAFYINMVYNDPV